MQDYHTGVQHLAFPIIHANLGATPVITHGPAVVSEYRTCMTPMHRQRCMHAVLSHLPRTRIML